MAEQLSHLYRRLRERLAGVRRADLKLGRLGGLFLVWLITFVLTYEPLLGSRLLFFFIHFWFWIKLLRELTAKVNLRTEYLVAGFLALAIVDTQITHFVHQRPGFVLDGVVILTPLLQGLQYILLVVMMLTISSILFQVSSGRRRGVFFYGFLMLFATDAFRNLGSSAFILFFSLLLVLLLSKTTWLEQLRRRQLWLYLLCSIILIRIFWEFRPALEAVPLALESSMIWHGMPHAFYLTAALYVSVLVIKIPIVLIYNFASIARKLRISGFFQSTVPQLLQLTVISLMIYFFFAGWQSEKVRLAVDSVVTQLAVFSPDNSEVFYFQVEEPEDEGELRLPGYRPWSYRPDFPEQAIFYLDKNDGERDLFYFSREGIEEEGSVWRKVTLVRIDTAFMRRVAAQTQVLAGTELRSYTFEPTAWQSYIYEFGIAGFTFWKDERSFQIFPFGFVPESQSDVLAEGLNQIEGITGDKETIYEKLDPDARLSLGRIIAPILDTSGQKTGYFAFDILLMPQLSIFSVSFLSYIAILLLVYLLINFLVTRRMVRFGSEIHELIVQRMNQLKLGIREIASGNLAYKINLQGEDEFVELAGRFNDMGDRLDKSLLEAREKERLQQELEVARRVQLDMLPRHLPDLTGFNIAVHLETANEVGGDFYDFIEQDDSRLIFIVGDVSGKSTSAAFYMAQCICLLRYSPQFTSDPKEILLRLNNYFAGSSVDRQIFVTAIFGVLNVQTSSLSFVRAGHTPPIFVPADDTKEISEVYSKGLGIGIEKSAKAFDANLTHVELTLQAGDMLVLVTDGVEEATRQVSAGAPSNEKEMYGTERLLEQVRKHRDLSAQELVDKLHADVVSFYRGISPVDDYTILVIEKGEGDSAKSLRAVAA